MDSCLILNYREPDYRVNCAMSVLLAFIVLTTHECPTIAAQRREYLQPSLQGREINVLNLLGEGGPIRDVLRFLREVNLYDEI